MRPDFSYTVDNMLYEVIKKKGGIYKKKLTPEFKGKGTYDQDQNKACSSSNNVVPKSRSCI